MGGHRLTAILAADIAGYSALIGANEIDTVAALKGHTECHPSRDRWVRWPGYRYSRRRCRCRVRQRIERGEVCRGDPGDDVRAPNSWPLRFPFRKDGSLDTVRNCKSGPVSSTNVDAFQPRPPAKVVVPHAERWRTRFPAPM